MAAKPVASVHEDDVCRGHHITKAVLVAQVIRVDHEPDVEILRRPREAVSGQRVPPDDHEADHRHGRDRVFTDLDEAAQLEVETTQQARLAEARADREARETARERLEAALTRLSPDDRAVITLVELEERTMEDAARRLDCGLSAIKVRAFRARRRLKAVLDELRPGKEEKP